MPTTVVSSRLVYSSSYQEYAINSQLIVEGAKGAEEYLQIIFAFILRAILTPNSS